MAAEIKHKKRKHKTVEAAFDASAPATVDESQIAIDTAPPEKRKKSKKKHTTQEEAAQETCHVLTEEPQNEHSLKTVKKSKKTKRNQQDASTMETCLAETEQNDKEDEKTTKKPKKLERNHNTAAVKDAKSEADENGNQDSGFEDIKFSKDFKMLHFREKLRGKEFITELRHFLHLSATRPQIIAKYIEKRGKPLELAEAFERIDKTNVVHAAYLCEALQLVTMEIVSHQKTHMESAQHACRYFLKIHGSVIDALLQSQQFQHRRIALKLLTAMVCVEPQFGRQLLSSYDVLSDMKMITRLLSYVPQEQHGTDTVRKCYIHFVLAFLVEGNVLLIRNILERVVLVRALIAGLDKDDHVTVCVVLNTLRQFVLECPHVSKTKKIHVFDAECCRHLARLYHWRRPAAPGERGALKAGKQEEKDHGDGGPVDPTWAAEHEAVMEALQQFLLLLLTSRKHGIAFEVTGNLRHKQNVIQGKFIGSLSKPWANRRKTELVLRILQACPDLARHTVRNYSGIVNTLRIPKFLWVQAADFLGQVIGTITPHLLRCALDKFTLADFTHWIKDICLPIDTLVLLNGPKLLQHRDYAFRVATTRLLGVMFRQYCNFMNVVRRRELARSGGASTSGIGPGPGSASRRPGRPLDRDAEGVGGVDAALRRFRFDLLNHILSHFPTVEQILSSLHLTTELQQDAAAVRTHLEASLDLVLAICEENPTFVNKTNTILDFLALLRPLYASPSADDVMTQSPEFAEANENRISIELKAIKTILLLSPRALEPRAELFASVLRSFVRAFVHSREERVRREAGALLRDIFRNTGMFEAGEYEIDLWLEPLRYCTPDSLELVTCVLIEVFGVSGSQVDLPKPAELVGGGDGDDGGAQLRQLFENIERGYSVQAYVETLAISKLMPLIFKGVAIVPGLAEYLETVSLLLLHYFPAPQQVRSLYQQELVALETYMGHWLMATADGRSGRGDVCVWPGEQALLPLPHLERLQRYILQPPTTGATSQFLDEIIPASMTLCDGKERLYLLYVQQSLFMVSQLVAQRRLERGPAQRAAECIGRCVSAAQRWQEEKTNGGVGGGGGGGGDSVDVAVNAFNQRMATTEADLLDDLLKYIFGIRLAYMGGGMKLFGGHGGDATHLNFMHFVRTIAAHCNALPNFGEHTLNYRLKIVKALSLALDVAAEGQDDDGEEGKNSSELAECIGLVRAFQLDAANCLELLQQFTRRDGKKKQHSAAAGQLLCDGKAGLRYELIVCLLQRLTVLLSRSSAATTSTEAPAAAPLIGVEDCAAFIHHVVKLYIKSGELAATAGGGSLEPFEEALEQFLRIAPQHIVRLEVGLFESMFGGSAERRLNKAAVRLASLLLERDERLLPLFVRRLQAEEAGGEGLLQEQRELCLPLLEVALQRYGEDQVPSEVLQRAYQAYKSGCMKLIEKPQKAGLVYRSHADCCVTLIGACLPPSECVDFCQRNLKFDAVEVPQMRLINAIYRRALQTAGGGKQRSLIFGNFVQLQLQMLALDLKRQSLSLEKLQLFAHFVDDWWRLAASLEPAQAGGAKDTPASKKKKRKAAEMDQDEDEIDQENVGQELVIPQTTPTRSDCHRIRQTGGHWMNFCRATLKAGMTYAGLDPQLEHAEAQKMEMFNALLLQLLAFLADRLYGNEGDKSAPDQDQDAAGASQEAGQLFQMICTHSKFVEILLQPTTTTATTTTTITAATADAATVLRVKTQVLHILCVLGRKSAAALAELPVPVLLGAYQARLSAADRYALAILQLLERHDAVALQQYRPLIWGESAVAFYALRANDEEERVRLQQQETSLAQVMSLIERPAGEYTLENFPIWRRLNAIEQLPAVKFGNPLAAALLLPAGANHLERRIEAADEAASFDADTLRVCPKSDGVYERCYDPAFLIPLLAMSFGPEAYTHTARPVQNGLLAVCFAALSSRDRDMRLAAACAQQRYRDHFAQRKFYERPLWLQAYENIQAGLAELRDAWMRHRRNSGTPRVPHIPAVFVARTFNLTTDPTHPLYRQLIMYLRLKSTFNFQCVPEFNVLFYSPEIEHQAMRQFVVELIRSGIKCSADLYLLVRTHVLKVLLGFYGNASGGEGMSTLDMNLLILSVLSTCVKIPAGVRLMVEHVGILPWLHTAISAVEFHQFDVIEGLISILNNFWYALHAVAGDLYNYGHLVREVHRLLLLLAPHLSARISVAHFAKFLNILQKTATKLEGEPQSHLAMSAEQLENLIGCAEKHFGQVLMAAVAGVRNIKAFGGEGVAPTAVFVAELRAERAEDVAVVALTQLRAYTVDWWRANCAERA